MIRLGSTGPLDVGGCVGSTRASGCSS